MKKSGQEGQALIVVLIVAALIAALAPALQALLQNRSEQMADRQRRQMTQSFLHDLRVRMMDPRECTRLLSGQVVDVNGVTDADLPNQWKDLEFRFDPLSAGIDIKAGALIPGTNVRLARIGVQMSSRARTPTGTIRRIRYDWPRNPQPNQFLKYYGEVFVAPENTRWNVNDPENRIKIALILHPTNWTVHQCHRVPSPAEVCEIAGGSFDAIGRSPLGLECNPQISCFTHQVMIVPSAAHCTGLYKGPDQHLFTNLYKPVAIGLNGMSPTFYCNWCNRWGSGN